MFGIFNSWLNFNSIKNINFSSKYARSNCCGYSVHFHSTGEHQQPHFPGLTRGLVAVLLYWDGKRCIANSLRALIQSRQGKTWTLELRSVLGLAVRLTCSLLLMLLGLLRESKYSQICFFMTWCCHFHV